VRPLRHEQPPDAEHRGGKNDGSGHYHDDEAASATPDAGGGQTARVDSRRGAVLRLRHVGRWAGVRKLDNWACRSDRPASWLTGVAASDEASDKLLRVVVGEVE
jgi:hypothetical protein